MGVTPRIAFLFLLALLLLATPVEAKVHLVYAHHYWVYHGCFVTRHKPVCHPMGPAELAGRKR
jgi:hypothetical protein